MCLSTSQEGVEAVLVSVWDLLYYYITITAIVKISNLYLCLLPPTEPLLYGCACYVLSLFSPRVAGKARNESYNHVCVGEDLLCVAAPVY